MKFSEERWEHAQTNLNEPGYFEAPPLAMFGGLLTLLSHEDVTGALTGCERADDRTSWRTVWLTATRLIHGEVSGDIADWNLDRDVRREVKQADAAVFWARPLTDIARVDLTDVHAERDRGREWTYQLAGRIVFTDAQTLKLPISASDTQYRGVREAIDSFLEALVNATIPKSTPDA